jgi:hypothetical protein
MMINILNAISVDIINLHVKGTIKIMLPYPHGLQNPDPTHMLQAGWNRLA